MWCSKARHLALSVCPFLHFRDWNYPKALAFYRIPLSTLCFGIVPIQCSPSRVLLFLHRDSHDPTLYQAMNYNKSKQELKSNMKPITRSPRSTEGTRPVSPGPGKRHSKGLALESSQVHGIIQEAMSGVVGNFVGITRAVRQRILPDKQLLEVCKYYPRFACISLVPKPYPHIQALGYEAMLACDTIYISPV